MRPTATHTNTPALTRPTVLAVIVCLFAVFTATAAQTVRNTTPTVEERLAAEFARASRSTIGIEIPTISALEAAVVLAREAAALDLENINRWRLVAQVASESEDDEALAEALNQMSRLDRDDDVVQLARLNRAIDARGQTLESRAEAVETILAAADRGEASGALASRLAFDLAMLHLRADDVDGYIRSLARALQYDSSNAAAAASAAGFLLASAGDAYGTAELLINWLMADPSNRQVQGELARLLIDEGASRGATRMYELLINSIEATRQIVPEPVIADLAIAQWAGDDVDAALRTLDDREREITVRLNTRATQLRRMEEANPGSTRDIPAMPSVYTLGTTAGTIRTAILSLERPGDITEEFELLRASFDVQRDTILDNADRAINVDPEEIQRAIAEIALSRAFVSLWLLKDVEAAETALAEANRSASVSDEAVERFAGWFALRRKVPEEAVAILEPMADADPLARLGLALAYEELENREKAVETLRALHEMRGPEGPMRGSLVGVWAKRKLEVDYGMRTPPAPETDRLEQLVTSIPRSMDSLPLSATSAIQVSIRGPVEEVQPFDPIPIRIELTNNSAVALAIDSAGPIRPSLILLPDTSMFLETRSLQATPPIVIDLKRRLRLEPRERLVIEIDAREYQLGQMLNAQVLPGAFIRLQAIVNHVVVGEGVYAPGPLGSSDRSDMVRVEGVNLSDLRDVLKRLRERPGRDTIRESAVIQRVAQRNIDPATLTDDQRKELSDMRNGVFRSFSTLDPVGRAWLVAVSPPGTLTQPIVDRIANEASRLPRIAYLIRHPSDLTDPILVAALASEDDEIRTVAIFVRERLLLLQQSR